MPYECNGNQALLERLPLGVRGDDVTSAVWLWRLVLCVDLVGGPKRLPRDCQKRAVVRDHGTPT